MENFEIPESLSTQQKEAILQTINFKISITEKTVADCFKMQLIRRIIYPYLIDQTDTPVCGVTVFVNWLTHHDPITYASISLQLVEKGKVTDPFLIKSMFKPTDFSHITVDELLLESIRNQQNILPYTKKSFDILESILSTTMGYEICNWLQKYFNKQINADEYGVTDTLIYLEAEFKKPISSLKESFFQLSHAKRINFPTIEDNLKNALAKHTLGCELIMLVTTNLAYKFIHTEKENKSLFGIEYGHYIKVSNIKHDTEKKQINIKYETWGTEISSSINYNDFLEGYRGVIIIKAPKKPIKEEKLENNQAKSSNI